jgi:hypothetical protein
MMGAPHFAFRLPFTDFVSMRTLLRRLPAPALTVLVIVLLGAAPHVATSQPAAPAVGPHLQELIDLAEEALEASRAAEQAQSVQDVKAGADAVFEAVWGLSSGLAADGARGASAQHGWTERWQTSPAAFDSAFAARLGTAGPEIDDPQQLGLMGRGRFVRGQFAVAPDSAGPETPGARYSHMPIVASLNNAIGWMRLDNGITKGELQPRIDLTYQWDAPIEFWQSSADTGWLQEAYAQAVNILKTDYDGDVAMARDHAAGMTQLLEKVLDGVDANDNGRVEPIMMEGGLRLALQEAQAAGLAGR